MAYTADTASRLARKQLASYPILVLLSILVLGGFATIRASARVTPPLLGMPRSEMTSWVNLGPEDADSCEESSRRMRLNKNSHMACLTAYWRDEADLWTARLESSSGVHLHKGHCAVDPRVIPYGSVVDIPGVGKFLAVDTGSAVIARTAARESGRNSEERQAIVIDLYFRNSAEAHRFDVEGPKFTSISWWEPNSKDKQAVAARKQFADADLHQLGMF